MKYPTDAATKDGLRIISASRAALWTRVSKLDWLTADEAALYCRVSLPTFEKMVKGLPIPFTRPAGPKGDRRFHRAHLDAALLSRVENTSSSPAA